MKISPTPHEIGVLLTYMTEHTFLVQYKIRIMIIIIIIITTIIFRVNAYNWKQTVQINIISTSTTI